MNNGGNEYGPSSGSSNTGSGTGCSYGVTNAPTWVTWNATTTDNKNHNIR